MKNRLAEFRKTLGKTQKDFAAELSVGQTTYNGYETGAREPRSDFWMKVSNKYGVTVDYLMGFSDDPNPVDRINKNSASSLSEEALSVARQYEAAPDGIRTAVRAVLAAIPVHNNNIIARKQTKIIPLLGQSFAAGVAETPGDMFMEKYETEDIRAEFAIHINGNSMEPYLPDGSIAVGVNRKPMDGEIGAFFLDGGFLVKQVCQDNIGNIYLFSLNRDRADADETVWHDAGRDLRVVGTILMDKHIPLP